MILDHRTYMNPDEHVSNKQGSQFPVIARNLRFVS